MDGIANLSYEKFFEWLGKQDNKVIENTSVNVRMETEDFKRFIDEYPNIDKKEILYGICLYSKNPEFGSGLTKVHKIPQELIGVTTED